MTATAMSVTDPARGRHLGARPVCVALLFGFVASLQISISSAQDPDDGDAAVLGGAALQEKRRPSAPAFFLPLCAYGAITLVSSLFSSDRVTSLVDSKQLVLLAIVPGRL
jgi:hypothetical protein